METDKSSGWFTGRNRLVTIASIAAVGITGAIAVGANVGILNASNNSNVGQVSAAGDLLPPTTQVVDVYLDATTTTTSVAVAGGQEFAVDTAGTATVSATSSSIRLDSVAPAVGWSWSMVQPNPSQLTVTFTNGTRTLEFTATAAPDGTISANVNEPIVTASPAPSAGSGGHESHEYEGGGDDD